MTLSAQMLEMRHMSNWRKCRAMPTLRGLSAAHGVPTFCPQLQITTVNYGDAFCLVVGTEAGRRRLGLCFKSLRHRQT